MRLKRGGSGLPLELRMPFFAQTSVMGALTIPEKDNKAKSSFNALYCEDCGLVSQYLHELRASIVYAKHIQESVLPRPEIFRSVFRKSFVLYMPRDMVSGDIYWFSIKKGKIIIAAIDCTGHGVPGALLSMIANNLLNQTVNEKNLTCPSNILYEVDRGLRKTFNQNTNGSGISDGMSVAVCAFDLSFTSLEFAGADMPLYVLKGNKAITLNGNRHAIGRSMTADNYENSHLGLGAGDRIYLMSDGLNDQFGGPENRKFMQWRFLEFIQSGSKMPIDEQGDALKKIIRQWKGDQRQTDDIMLIGIEA